MGGLSIWHWIIVLFFVFGYLVPLWRIVNKAGFHGALSLLALIPFVNVVMLWVFAFVRWPVERDST
ncbi:MAG: hypothetical protein ACREO7_06355 [Pseudoxanthomonas sp.]